MAASFLSERWSFFDLSFWGTFCLILRALPCSLVDRPAERINLGMKGAFKFRRMLQLIDLLRSGRTYNTRELAELSGISRRQVFRDLKALQDSGVPLLFDQQRQGY